MDTDRDNEDQEACKKDWLGSTGLTLSKLSSVQPLVYNVGTDSRQEVNGSARVQGRSSSMSSLGQDTMGVSQRTAWGSNTSIPELMKQYNVSLPRRPESAKTKGRVVRPPSGRRLRPESAKESQRKVKEFAESLVPRPPKIAVKGAKFDPSDRPPRGAASHHTSVGWVGGANFDISKDDACQSLQQFIQDHQVENVAKLSAAYARVGEVQGPPPPPTGSPDLERMLQGSASESESQPEAPPTVKPEPEPVKPPPGPIHFSLPSVDDDDALEDRDDHEGTGDSTLQYFIEDTAQRSSVQGEENKPAKEDGVPKTGVKIAEELNTTIDITPRGRVSRYYSSRAGTPNIKNATSRVDSGLKKRPSAGGGENGEDDDGYGNLDEGERRTVSQQFPGRPSSANDRTSNKGILKSSSSYKSDVIQDRHRNLISHKHNKGTAIVPKPSTVEIAYNDGDDDGSDKEDVEIIRKMVKHKSKVVTDKNLRTAVANVGMSDDDDEKSGQESEGEKTVPSFTRIKSSREKNFYELLRQSSSKASKQESDVGSAVVKTTKTLEFGSGGLEESKSVTVVDNLSKPAPPVLTRLDKVPKPKVIQKNEKSTDSVRNSSHASEMTHSPVRRDVMSCKISSNSDELPPRPGSRIGHHVMPPCEERPNVPLGNGNMVRPNSAALSRRSVVSASRQGHVLSGGGIKLSRRTNPSEVKGHSLSAEGGDEDGCSVKEDTQSTVKPTNFDDVKTLVGTSGHGDKDDGGDGEGGDSGDDDGDGGNDLFMSQPVVKTSTPVEDRSRQMNTLKSKARIQSAPLPVKRMMQDLKEHRKERTFQNAVMSATKDVVLSEVCVSTKPGEVPGNQSSSSSNVSSRKHTRSSSAYLSRHKQNEAEPVVITTKREEVFLDNQQVRDCKNMHFKMLEKGVDIPVDKLTRALLPPGEGSIHSVTTQLPRETSSGLLSHPSVWLSKEFKRLKLAQKAVQLAHERLWEQEQRAKREAGQVKGGEAGLGKGGEGTVKKKKKRMSKTALPRKRTSTVS